MSIMLGLLHVLVLLGGTLCLNEVDDGIYADRFDQEMYDELDGEGEPADPPCDPDMSHWDKVFIALEDSHMRESILLESLDHCCRGAVADGNRVDRLYEGTCQHCLSGLQSMFRAQMGEVRLSLRRHLMELKASEAERERSLNETLQRRRPDDGLFSLGPADGLLGQTQRPAGSGSGMRIPTITPVPMVQEVMSPLDKAALEMSLVAMARDLLKVQTQLSRVIEQLGTSTKGGGST